MEIERSGIRFYGLKCLYCVILLSGIACMEACRMNTAGHHLLVLYCANVYNQ